MERIKRRNKAQWVDIIAEQEKSGMSAKVFCSERSIGLASFYQWRRRISNDELDASPEKRGEKFIEMGRFETSEQSPMTDATSRWTVTLELGGGMRLKLETGRV